MKRALLNISAFILLLFACNKNDTSPAGGEHPPAEEWLLSKLTRIDVESRDTLVAYPVFEENKLAKIMESDVVTRAFEYTGNNIIRINESEAYYDVIYNAEHKISEVRWKSTIYKLTWENENVKSMTTFNVYNEDTTQGSTKNYTYGNKKIALKDNCMWLCSPLSFELLSFNNLVKQETVFAGEVHSRDTYEYKFNEKDLLVEQKVRSEQLINDPSVSNRVITFSYTKK
ncbi:hypothetical protein GFS24_18150 [Chitinophaga sp. SYP-B3965]|uniref:hypothetical protein n=1 Tax=Chitinophaga sp. SYP-B3965 TaxID=2663120 RepID=UPI0012998604|nr:hypothetical protein [Chitinophaga sp. SYP-B3965]MRG47051.1 hypothetical protein [Chitinophaga sp. SYP-B3965]